MSNYLRFEMRLKLGSTLQSICNRRQREQAAAGAWTISHLSCGKPHFPSLACCKDYGHGDIVLSTSMRVCALWLTFCCLHSLHAFLLPPRRFPVLIGGIFSISQGSEFLLEKS